MHLARRALWKGLIRRGGAAICAAMILGLGVFAVSPDLHERLHDGMGLGADHHCAVEIFAGGLSVPLDSATIVPPRENCVVQRSARPVEICLSSPRFLLQPERGPPAV